MNYAELKADLFAALEQKTSWGRNELKSVIDDVFLAAADKELARKEQVPEKRVGTDPATQLDDLLYNFKPYDDDNATATWPEYAHVGDPYDGDNGVPWR